MFLVSGQVCVRCSAISKSVLQRQVGLSLLLFVFGLLYLDHLASDSEDATRN